MVVEGIQMSENFRSMADTLHMIENHQLMADHPEKTAANLGMMAAVPDLSQCHSLDVMAAVPGAS